jgi:hypothetical protein
MATATLTALQLGAYDTSTGLWSDAVVGLLTFGGTVQMWAQVDKTIPLVNTVSSLVQAITPTFTESGTLTMMTMQVAVVRGFDIFNFPPTPFVTIGTAAVSFSNGVATNVTYPLTATSTSSAASALHGEMRRRYRAHSGGQHRFVIGLAFDGTGGTVAAASPVLTYNDEFTGWGDRRGQPGTDRAVRCPRCGNVTNEKSLVRDGLLRLDVCGECYDPPEQPSNFIWPFRS